MALDGTENIAIAACLFTEPPADLTECHKGKRDARGEIMLLPDGDDRPKIGEVTWFGCR